MTSDTDLPTFTLRDILSASAAQLLDLRQAQNEAEINAMERESYRELLLDEKKAHHATSDKLDTERGLRIRCEKDLANTRKDSEFWRTAANEFRSEARRWKDAASACLGHLVDPLLTPDQKLVRIHEEILNPNSADEGEDSLETDEP